MEKDKKPAPNSKAQTKTEPKPAANSAPAGLPTYAEVIKKLSERIPPEVVFMKERGGKEFPFMNITDCVDLLDASGFVWQSSVASDKQIGNDYVIVIRIEILCAEGWIGKESTGIEEINLASYGDTSSNAFAMAFKRAASQFGLGRELWQKHDYFASEPSDRAERRAERQNQISGERSNVAAGGGNRQWQPSEKPNNPLAASVGDMLTGAQRGKIFGTAKDLNISAEDFVENHLHCKVDELSKKAASWAIDNLGKLPVNPNSAPPNGSSAPKPSVPANFSDEAAPATIAQLKALQITIDNLQNKSGVEETVILAEFAAVGCRNVSVSNAGEFMTENLTGERAGALISRFNYISQHGV